MFFRARPEVPCPPEHSRLSLYAYDSCYYCSRVQRALDELGLSIEKRDVLREPARRQELLRARGRGTVPVLRIDLADGETIWLPESRDIVAFLRRCYGARATGAAPGAE